MKIFLFKNYISSKLINLICAYIDYSSLVSHSCCEISLLKVVVYCTRTYFFSHLNVLEDFFC